MKKENSVKNHTEGKELKFLDFSHGYLFLSENK